MATAGELGAVDRGRRMFRVDLSENRLVRLKERRFADLNLRERDHLQEWLVRMPDALGEEFLIVQKEFDGFADTRERLDLLALDKEGRLVVVENKLDWRGAVIPVGLKPQSGAHSGIMLDVTRILGLGSLW